jgi:5-methyltetrahydrofolate--homocysteine methyltransferase
MTMTHDEILQGLFDNTLIGNKPEVADLVNLGLKEGLEPSSMLFDALIPSLEEVGARFERGDYFVPEMLIAARAMQGALDILRPLLVAMLAMMLGSVLQISLWGVLFLVLGEFDELYEAVYHSAVNFASR